MFNEQATTQHEQQANEGSVSIAGSDPTAVEQAIRTELRRFDPTMAVELELASDVVGDAMSIAVEAGECVAIRMTHPTLVHTVRGAGYRFGL